MNDYFFVNTNQQHAPDRYPVWLHENLAFTHGDDDDLKILRRLTPGSICLMWIDSQGLKAIGKVLEHCDGKPYRHHLIKREEHPDVNEYRIRVDWFLHLDKPYPYSELTKREITTPPRPSVQPIKQDKQKVEKLVDDLVRNCIEDYPAMLVPSTAEDEWIEGNAHHATVTRYARSSEARADCLKELGYSCSVCGYNFEDVFGEKGKGIIQVHHLKPLSQCEGPRRVSGAQDLIPVCPNCHVMIHSRPNIPPYTPDEVKELMCDSNLGHTY